MRIIHAVADENGKAKGGQLGDQTGREIRAAEWYDKQWDAYIEPKDYSMGVRAAEAAEKICAGNFGYNQADRFSGYDAIKADGYDSVGDFDCSSLVVSCYIFAGANLKPVGYTGNLDKLFEQSGQFNVYHDSVILHDPNYAVCGGLYLRKNSHVLMCVEDGNYIREAEIDEDETDDEAIEDRFIGTVTALGSVRVRMRPKDGNTVKILHKGESLGILTEDYETGWYYTDLGWITNNTQYVSVKMKENNN